MKTEITEAQAAFLADLGIGREVFAPNPSVKKALWERRLIATRFIGQRWWWVQPTQAGKDALVAWNARHAGDR